MLYKCLKPALFALDPEKIHNAIHLLGKISTKLGFNGLLKAAFSASSPAYAQNIMGLHFPNPLGLAAGFDKNGDITQFMTALGFGFVEIGSLTAKPWQGNPQPRLFRLPQDLALINRMGLNNHGVAAALKHLQKATHTVPLGINITKTPDPKIMGEAGIQDFCDSFKAVLPLADYVTLNISCPNTAEGKTFEEPGTLRALLQELEKIKDETPILIKISSDMDEPGLDQILEISEGFGISGYVLGNTSLSREQLKTSPVRLAQIGRGGLSGKPLAQRSLAQIKSVRKKLPHTVIMGCGGIFTAADAQERLQAGANLLQIYTGLIYEGPSLCKNILRGLKF